MTKTKQQLRAEAVERLRELNAYADGPESIVEKLAYGLSTDRLNYHVEIEHIIDLLTDDCGPCYSCAKLAELRAENNALRGKVDELANGNDGETNGIRADAPLVNVAKILCEADDGSLRLKAFAYDPHSLTKLADMVERDYVRREECVALGKSLGIAQAERDEWKAKAETRNDGVDCGHLADMSVKDAYCVRDGGEMSDVDSREKLEADMKERLGELWAHAWDAGSRDSMDDDFDIDVFNSLLDRQEEITKRECADTRVSFAERMRFGDKIDELQSKVDRLTRENVSLAHDLGECMAERDELRAAYDELTAIAAQLCRACGFSMVDASGEVVG